MIVLAALAIVVVIVMTSGAGAGGSKYSSADEQAVLSQCEGAGNSLQACRCAVSHVESVLSPVQFHDSVIAVTAQGEEAFAAADRLCGVSA
jgi:hypothetical protein